MNFRFGEYTLYDGHIVSITDYYGHGLSSEYENLKNLRSPNKINGFKQGEDNVYSIEVKLSDLNNAFRIDTFGVYHNNEVLVFNVPYDKNLIRIQSDTRNIIPDAFESIDEHGKPYFMKDVLFKEIDYFFEKRTESKLGLPFPSSVAKNLKLDVKINP